MTKAGSVAASIVAVSSAALAAATFDRHAANSSSHYGDGSASKRKGQADGSAERTSSEDKFAPRFDGLRFIETLVTAHR